MKKLISTIFAAVVMSASVFAQAPQKITYQAVIRNSGNNLVTSAVVGVRISILQGSATGTPVYVETQTPTTNANGLISIEIGGGTVVSGTFASIVWSNGLYFIKTETDPTGGTTYSITGTNQLLSVPYAFHSKTAESVTVPISETDPIFGSSIASGIIGTDTTNWNNKLDNFTEVDPIFGTSVANGITTLDTVNWNNKLDTEVDGSVTNEIQTLSVNGNDISISAGNTITIPPGPMGPAGFGGANLSFPDGFDNLTPIVLCDNYTVPSGKNLYLTYTRGSVYVNGVFLWNPLQGFTSTIIVGENQSISITGIACNSGTNWYSLSSGFLVDVSVTAVTNDGSTDYTVPVGKNLYITQYRTSTSCKVDIGGQFFYLAANEIVLHSPIIIPSGAILNGAQFNGYIK